uniref:Uncharacterized protein n=1 Tax=Avena sativa TaxID=4498 RepID=A0ACD5TY78_AVESA
MPNSNEKGSLFLLAASAAVIAVVAVQVKLVVAAEYTDKMVKCVRGIVEDPKNKPNAPGLIRLLFHDAMVRGLDGSVLLTSTPFNTTSNSLLPNLKGPTEQGSLSNGGLRGMEMIDEIRAKLAEKNIIASCADAVAFAAREATFVLSNGKIEYAVDGPGRQDGVVSAVEDPGRFLPAPTYSYEEILTNFTSKGFTKVDLVALSGAHAVGVAHPLMFSFADRFLPSATIENKIDPFYRAFMLLETKDFTDPQVDLNVRDMTPTTQTLSGYKPDGVNTSAVGVLDNSYYNANLQNMVLFTSDTALRGNAEQLLEDYKKDANVWNAAFSAAMTKLSNTLKAEGPIFEDGSRKKCSATNHDNQDSYSSAKPLSAR